jgi:anaerobic ribonucleoside-triphosphate reductase activating protein
MVIRIGTVLSSTVSEGPGTRAAFWTQGCSIKCPGCCNPELKAPERGEPKETFELASTLASSGEDGMTILGGEPLDQATAVADVIMHYRNLVDRSVWLFTGYTWNELRESASKSECVSMCDVVIAGPFDPLSPDTRRWIGSSNQTIHFLTPRDRYLELTWPHDIRDIEFFISETEIVVNGWPISSCPDGAVRL